MLERATGRALLMDFGISRTITATVENKGLTRVGEVVGTPEYMSPEQASGDVVDGRSDLYSLGLVALFALTGKPAITADTTQKILVKQLTESPPAAQTLRPDLPPALAEAIDRCVAKLPDDRFPTAEALVDMIDAAQIAAPEIPLPIRLFAQEVGTLGIVLTFLVIVTWLLVMSLRKQVPTIIAIIPAFMLAAIGFTRILQASSTARRLAILGFHPDDVNKGMRAVVSEREQLREQIKNDPDTKRRRKATRIAALIMLPTSIMLLRMSGAVSVTLGDKANTTTVPVGTTSGAIFQAAGGRLALAALGLSLFGAAMILLIRSPFRMPIGERLFRLIWIGVPGRAFLRLSMRGVAAAPARNIGTRPATAVTAAPAPVITPRTAKKDPITALEARVAELERWRNTAR